MIELRYNGCPDCLKTAKTVMRNLGFFPSRDFIIAYHKEHKSDAIYQKRPDYLKKFTGCILYNTESEHWIDFYNSRGELVFGAEGGDHDYNLQLVQALIAGN